MGRSTFSGPVVSQAGFITGTGAVLAAVTASTLTIPAAVSDNTEIYNGQLIPLSRAAGIAVTLPASSGSQASYRFFVSTTITSNTTTIKVANSTDIMVGIATVSSSGTAGTFPTTVTADTITLNGSTTGGVAGSYIELTDVSTGFWVVTAYLEGSGVAATPFSATV